MARFKKNFKNQLSLHTGRKWHLARIGRVEWILTLSPTALGPIGPRVFKGIQVKA
jgi:hypothetical protein